MTPELLKHNEIDFDKWDACASQTPNQMVYAFSWYLNIVTQLKWDGIVWGDYQAIMPLPYNRKLIRKQVYLPSGVQQLGPFGNLDLVDPKDIIKLLANHYLQYVVSTNLPLNSESFLKRNLTLSLKGEYKESIYSRYKKNRRYDSRQAYKYKIKKLSVDDFLSFYCNFSKTIISRPVNEFKHVVQQLNTTDKFIFFGIYLEENLLSVVGLSNSNQRLTLLFSSTNPRGFKNNANSILLDDIFQKYSEQGYVFDFEGSEISGVRNYFLSFGPFENQYFITQKRSQIYQLLKK